MKELHELIKYLKDNGYSHLKVNPDLLIGIIEYFANKQESKQCNIADVISRFSGEDLMKLQKHFVSLYGSDEMAKEKANSFAVGFGKACELMCKDLSNGL